MAGPLLILPTVCLSLPRVSFCNVCPLKYLSFLICPVFPSVSLPVPQLRSQGSHFVHPLVAGPGSFAMPSHWQRHWHRAEKSKWPKDQSQGVRGLKSHSRQGEKAELFLIQGDLPAQQPPETQPPTFQP